MTTDNDDQRNYFRVSDTATLEYILVSQNEIDGSKKPESYFSSSAEFWLLRELQTIDHDNSHLLKTISERDREIASYLKSINRKIDLLATTLVQQNHKNDENLPQDISLSEGGIAFFSKEELPLKQHMAMKLNLMPSNIGLMIFGHVVETNYQEQEQKFRTSVSFVSLQEGDRHLLARHIMQLQSAAQREKLQLS